MPPPPLAPDAVIDARGWPPPEEVTIGIMAALPIEAAAMARLIEGVHVRSDFPRDPNTYRLGSIPSVDPSRPHGVAFTVLPQDGTRNAAAVCTNLLRTFENVRCVIMVGVAGGIPRPNDPSRHVRLGDIVVATRGIVDYGHVRQIDGERKLRRSDGHISNLLLRVANELRIRETHGERPWEYWLDPDRCELARDYPRPGEETDRLLVRGMQIPHPDHSGHVSGRTRVHYGSIGSADVLMRDEAERDRLAQEFDDMLAVEMEGSGIAAGTAGFDVSWFMVRSVVDYCETVGKNDIWHSHSSYVAAAYVRTLLECFRPYPAMTHSVMPLVQQPENDHLLALLDRLGPSAPQQLREVWDAAVPYLPEPPQSVLSSAAGTYFYLSGYNAAPGGLAPVLAFVDEFATTVPDETLAGELQEWVEAQADLMRASDALLRRRSRTSTARRTGRAKPCLVIEIMPIVINRAQCEIRSWIQERSGPWRPRPGPGVPKRVALAEAEAFVGYLVDRAEQEWHEVVDIVALEFLLPADLINLPVEWWRPSAPAHERIPLGVDYHVVLRSHERMHTGDRPRMWYARWSALLTAPLTMAPYWGANPRTAESLKEWETRLRADATMAVVVLSTPPEVWPGSEELGMALLAGVPVVLWDRSEARTEDETQTIRDLVDGDLAMLPHRIHSMRIEAATAGTDWQEHQGGRLALLWDDPSRVISGRAVA